jgi:hypothetical protein
MTFDEHEAEFMKGLLEEYPEEDPHFGPYFADCSDCGGYVELGRITEEEAATEAQKHRAAFQQIKAASWSQVPQDRLPEPRPRSGDAAFPVVPCWTAPPT